MRFLHRMHCSHTDTHTHTEMYTHLISPACGKTRDPEQEGVSPAARTDNLGAIWEMEGGKEGGVEGAVRFELGAREGGLE